VETRHERDFVRDAGRFQAWMLRRRAIKHQSKHQKILGRREKIRREKGTAEAAGKKKRLGVINLPP
jgi:hypothetical protein